MKPTPKPEQKSYRKGSSLYFSAGLVLSMVLVVTAFEWKTPYVVPKDGPIVILADSEPPMDLIIKQVPTPPREKSTEILPVAGDPPLEVEPVDLEPPVIDEPSTPTDPGPIVIPGAGLPDEKAPETSFSSPAVPSEGYEAFYAYLYKNLSIPDHLIQQNKSGKIRVSFVVNTDGKLTDIEIVKGFDQQLEKQIIKILQESAAWEAAWKDGRKVNVRMELPVVIKIN